MDLSKRQLIKLLPLATAAIAGTVITEGAKAEAVEVKPTKRYVFRVSSDNALSREEFDRFSKVLQEKGFTDSLIVQGIDILEIQ